MATTRKHDTASAVAAPGKGPTPAAVRDSATDGTQAIERAITLLRFLATRGRLGWGLTDLADASGLKKATAHRILARLERERMVHRRASDAHYFLGPMLAELSYSIPGLPVFVREVQDFLIEVSRRHGLVAIVLLRSGDHFVTIGRVAPARFKGELNEPGARRPLITTAGGIAILLALERREANRLATANLELLSHRGRSSVADFAAMWSRSKKSGFACNFGDIAPGVNAVAVPVCDAAGRPFGSLTFAGGEAHLPRERAAELLRERVELVRLIAQVHPALYAGTTGPAG